MPTSAKPRKPHRGVHLPSAYQAAKHFTDILIRGFRGWGRQDKMRVGFFFLEPFGALRASKGTDAEAHQIDAARGNLRPGGKRARMYDKVEADLDQAALGGKHGLRRVSA